MLQHVLSWRERQANILQIVLKSNQAIMLATRNSGRSYGSGVKILWLHDWVPTQNRSEKKLSTFAQRHIFKHLQIWRDHVSSGSGTWHWGSTLYIMAMGAMDSCLSGLSTHMKRWKFCTGWINEMKKRISEDMGVHLVSDISYVHWYTRRVLVSQATKCMYCFCKVRYASLPHTL